MFAPRKFGQVFTAQYFNLPIFTSNYYDDLSQLIGRYKEYMHPKWNIRSYEIDRIQY